MSILSSRKSNIILCFSWTSCYFLISCTSCSPFLFFFAPRAISLFLCTPCNFSIPLHPVQSSIPLHLVQFSLFLCTLCNSYLFFAPCAIFSIPLHPVQLFIHWHPVQLFIPLHPVQLFIHLHPVQLFPGAALELFWLTLF